MRGDVAVHVRALGTAVMVPINIGTRHGGAAGEPGHRRDLAVTLGLHLRIRRSARSADGESNASVEMLQLPSEFRVRTANFQFEGGPLGNPIACSGRRVDEGFARAALCRCMDVSAGANAMTDKKQHEFKTIPTGTKVTWHYRSAIGHGTVKGIHKMGTNADNTMYSIAQHDHHPGEPAIVHHSGKALTKAR